MLQVQDDVRPLTRLIGALLRSEAISQSSAAAEVDTEAAMGPGDVASVPPLVKKRKRVVGVGPDADDGGVAAALQLPAEGEAIKQLHEFAVRLLAGARLHLLIRMVLMTIISTAFWNHNQGNEYFPF